MAKAKSPVQMFTFQFQLVLPAWWRTTQQTFIKEKKKAGLLLFQKYFFRAVVKIGLKL